MTVQADTSLLKLARSYARAGLRVIPIRTDGSKAPAVKSWEPFKKTPATEAQLKIWFENGTRRGMAAICGAPSGGLEVIDIDEALLVEPYLQTVRGMGGAELVGRLVRVKTPRGGAHLFYSCPDGVEGSQKLACRPKTKNTAEKTLIETRGEGAYVILSGSPTECHPTKKAYELLRGDLSHIPEITASERELLLRVGKSFDERLACPSGQAPQLTEASCESGLPGQDFNRRASWDQVLEPHGWKLVYRRGEVAYWQRPKKEGRPGISATSNHGGHDQFFVFTSNGTPFEPDRGYTKFTAHALLNHGGNFKAAARELARQGYGQQERARLNTVATRSSNEVENLDAEKQPWLDPLPLVEETPLVEPLLPEMLPDAFRCWLMDTAERMNVPLDYPAAAAIVSLSAVVGRRARIIPKREDVAWEIVPNLWGGVVGRPGTQKTPAISEGMAGLVIIEKAALANHENEKASYARKNERFKIEQEAWRDNAKKMAKQGKPYQDFRGEKPEEPSPMRFMTNDATPEKLHELLRDNPGGILYFRDELSAWLAMLDRPERSTDRGFLLECWIGLQGHTIDRIGRGTVHVPVCCVSVFGGIQPSKLLAYLSDGAQGGLSDDGLLQRLQVLVWPEVVKQWKLIDRPPHRQAKKEFCQVFERLARLDPKAPITMQFADEAQELFYTWWRELEERLRDDSLPESFVSHLSKYRSLMPSLALLFTLADWAQTGSGNISSRVAIDEARKAAAWCAYLERHAQKIYSRLTAGGLMSAQILAEKIQAGMILPERFAAREVYRPQWSGLTSPEEAQQALAVLVDHYWLRVEDQKDTGGRPTRLYRVNPKVERRERPR